MHRKCPNYSGWLYKLVREERVYAQTQFWCGRVFSAPFNTRFVVGKTSVTDYCGGFYCYTNIEDAIEKIHDIHSKCSDRTYWLAQCLPMNLVFNRHGDPSTVRRTHSLFVKRIIKIKGAGKRNIMAKNYTVNVAGVTELRDYLGDGEEGYLPVSIKGNGQYVTDLHQFEIGKITSAVECSIIYYGDEKDAVRVARQHEGDVAVLKVFVKERDVVCRNRLTESAKTVYVAKEVWQDIQPITVNPGDLSVQIEEERDGFFNISLYNKEGELVAQADDIICESGYSSEFGADGVKILKEQDCC